MVGQAPIVGHGETLKLERLSGHICARTPGTNSTCVATTALKLVANCTHYLHNTQHTTHNPSLMIAARLARMRLLMYGRAPRRHWPFH